MAAKYALADLPLQEIVENPLVPPEEDDVSRLILETHDQQAFSTIKSMTVGQLREFILGDEANESALKKLQAGTQRMPLDANPATAHMFIVNPLRAGGLVNLFSTHPPMEERIARLEAMVYGQPVR